METSDNHQQSDTFTLTPLNSSVYSVLHSQHSVLKKESLSVSKKFPPLTLLCPLKVEFLDFLIFREHVVL